MGFDGGRADYQSSSDLGIVQAFDHQGKHFTLPSCQVKAWHGGLVNGFNKLLSDLWRKGQRAPSALRGWLVPARPPRHL